MLLHRDLLLGTGFYDTLRANAALRRGDSIRAIQPLPTIPLLDITNRDFVDTLMAEVLPDDRARFTEYLSNRPLGLGIITGVSSDFKILISFVGIACKKF